MRLVAEPRVGSLVLHRIEGWTGGVTNLDDVEAHVAWHQVPASWARLDAIEVIVL